MAQLVEHILGKDEVPSSNLGSSSKKTATLLGLRSFCIFYSRFELGSASLTRRIQFAYPSRRSGSSLTRRRDWVYSSSTNTWVSFSSFRNPFGIAVFLYLLLPLRTWFCEFNSQNPVRISHSEICKLACKAESVDIFIADEYLVASKKQLSVVFCAAKPPKARSEASRRLAEAKTRDYATVEENKQKTTKCCFLRSETAQSKERGEP